LYKIDAIAGTVIDPQFRDATADWFYVAQITKRQTSDTGIDSRTRIPISQAVEPPGESFGLADFDL
jgi:hypothetical protein